MAASCDIVLASSAAEFSAPGSRRGRFCHTPGVGLAERVGPSRALGAPPPPPSTATQRNTLSSPRAEMLLLGDTWTADQAHVYGLVTKVFEPDGLLAGAQQVAESLSVWVSSAAIVVSALLLEPCRPAPHTLCCWQHGKRSFREHQKLAGLEAKYLCAEHHMATAMATEDAAEGTRSLLERRRGRYEG